MKSRDESLKLISLHGACCILVVKGYGDEIPEWKWIDVQLVSTHSAEWHQRWRTRLHNAWDVLRNRYDWSGFDINGAEEADALIAALQEARQAAFGK